ncbi:MAG TPA: response regulator transcription factor [Chroococcales cyanobacterium]
MAKILLVEDEHDLAVLIRDWLEGEVHLVEIVENGLEALTRLANEFYDLMILDLLLPGLDGMEVCKRYRAAHGSMPILMLTAKSSVDEREAGLDAGADDYLTKPFHLKELAARIRVLLRRNVVDHNKDLKVKGIVLDTMQCKVTVNGREVHLLPKEYRLLEFLMRHPNQVFSAESLLNHVWESDTTAALDTVRGHIMRLRSKIDVTGETSVISTHRRLGYKLNTE